MSAEDFPYIVYVMLRQKLNILGSIKQGQVAFSRVKNIAVFATFLKLEMYNNQHRQDENQTFLESKARWANQPA